MTTKRQKNAKYHAINHQNQVNEQAKVVKETYGFIKPKTHNQKLLVDSIKHNTFTLGIGPAGTGRTLCSLFTAWCLINNPDIPIDKIVYVRANIKQVEESDLGSTPGSKTEKCSELAYAVRDNLTLFMSREKADYLLEKEIIEVSNLGYLRGRSLNRTIIILDEAQQVSPKGMLTVFTRCGEYSKVICIGDGQQRDNPRIADGLTDAVGRFKGAPDFGIVRFTIDDVVRNEGIKIILDRYKDIL